MTEARDRDKNIDAKIVGNFMTAGIITDLIDIGNKWTTLRKRIRPTNCVGRKVRIDFSSFKPDRRKSGAK